MQAEIVGVSFAVEPGHAAYVPLAHTYPGAPQQLDREEVLRLLQPLLEDAGRAKLGHHLKYDAHVLRNHGIELRGMRFDSMLESYVLNSTATRHDLDSTAQLYLGVETIRYEDVAGKGAKQLAFNDVPVEAAAEYSAEDADVALRLHRTLWPRLDADARRSRGCTRRSSSRSCRCCSTWSTAACWSTRRCCGSQSQRAVARAWSNSSGARTRSPASRSTSNRRNSCRKCCSASSACPSSARRRPASRRRRKTCSRNSPKNSSCRA